MKVGDKVQRRSTVGLEFCAMLARGRITKIEDGIATVDWKLPHGKKVPDSVVREVKLGELELVPDKGR